MAGTWADLQVEQALQTLDLKIQYARALLDLAQRGGMVEQANAYLQQIAQLERLWVLAASARG